MHFHLLSLETFEPHPLARKKVLEWPETLVVPRIELSFQICDEGLFVIKHNTPDGPADLLCGWQWTTGRLGVVSDYTFCLAPDPGLRLRPYMPAIQSPSSRSSSSRLRHSS